MSVLATDHATLGDASPRTERVTISLGGRGARGALEVGVRRPASWSDLMDVEASLHIPDCDAGVNVIDHADTPMQLSHGFAARALTLFERPSDAGLDAGTVDAGFDAGFDAGVDAGLDAGTDAGVPGCDAGFERVRGGTETWADVAQQPGALLLAGDALGSLSDAGVFTSYVGGNCNRTMVAVWRRPSDGKVYAVSAFPANALLRIDGLADCVTLSALQQPPTGLWGFESGGSTTVFVTEGGATPQIERFVNNVGAGATTVADAGDELRDVDGLSPTALYAVGQLGTSHRALVLFFNGTTWTTAATSSVDDTPLNAVHAYDATTVFAGGAIFATGHDTTWTIGAPPPFALKGLRAVGPQSVYGVGSDGAGNAAVAHWDGTSWTALSVAPFAGTLLRLRGPDSCSLAAVGTNGLVFTSR